MDKQYFGEGMTILNDKIFWLTWQAKKGFVYNLETFQLEKEFAYDNSAEGWGFTNNGVDLIKSDGTHKIWFLDSESQKEKRAIQVYTNKYAVDDLNELELIDEKLYANKYQQNAIVIIDIKTGEVLGVADLTDLKKEMEKNRIYIQKIDKEKMHQQLEKARQELAKVKMQFSADSDNLMIDGKKVKVTKKIEIKAPKGATFDLNTRHCKVKLPNTVAVGNVKYGSFDANNLNNSKLTINYSPVNINDLTKSNVYLNNVTDAKIASVTNTKINTNYSNVDIQNIYKNVDISAKFGGLHIQKIHADYTKFLLYLQYTNAIINLQNLDKNLLFEIKSMPNSSVNPSMKLNVLHDKSKKINGNFIIKTKDTTFFVNGKYSQITVNQ